MLDRYGVAAASALRCAALAGRLHGANNGLFGFLLWNLIPGLVPPGLSSVMLGVVRMR